MKKILPFSDNPIIKTYPYIAFYLGILEGNGIDITNLIIKEFSHVFFFRGKLDFTASGFFHKKYFRFKPNKYFIKKSVDNIVNEIDKNHYVIVILNEKFLNNSKVSVDIDFPHDWLIYGYDYEEKMFYCAGYGEQSGLRRYETLTLSFEEIKEALKKTPLVNNYTFTSKDTHSTWIKKKPNIEVNRFYIKKLLYKFLNPQIISIYHRPIINLDVNAINLLKLSLNKKIQNWENEKNKKLWTQSYRILYENINVLKIIAKKYITNEKISEELEKLSLNAYSLLLTVGKYNISPKKTSLIKIFNYLDDIYSQEKEIVTSIIKNL